MDNWILRLIYDYHGNGILLYVLITMTAAGALSACIGLERQLKGEAAGVRTHALLAIGSSLLMTISVWAIRIADGFLDLVMGTVNVDLNYDTSRIAAGVVTGIGFLGGGVIIRDKFSVRGLATASTLWICTAIGLACGAGFVWGAIIATAIVLFTLISLSKVIDIIDKESPTVIIRAKGKYPVIEKVRDFSENNGLQLKNVTILQCDDEETVASISYIFTTDDMILRYMCNLLEDEPEVLATSIRNSKFRKRSRNID